MSWSFRIAKVKGIEIRVHATFALVLLWAALDWGVWRGLGLAGALYGVALVGLLFVCVTLHELGHSLVARHYGDTLLGGGGNHDLGGAVWHGDLVVTLTDDDTVPSLVTNLALPQSVLS